MITPYGGELLDKRCSDLQRKDVEQKASTYPTLTISNRIAADCELLGNGAYSPLQGFMTKAEAESVVEQVALPNGTCWSIPVVLPLPAGQDGAAFAGKTIALRLENGTLIATLEAGDVFTLDLDRLCRQVFKTTETAHAGAAAMLDQGNRFLAGRLLQLVNRPIREDIAAPYFVDPKEVRAKIAEKGWQTAVAFQTRNPIHRAHEYLLKCAQESFDGALIHPLVGETKSDDIPAPVRMKCYEALTNSYFAPSRTLLSVLPAAMRYAGPREAVHHMIMRQNYGATHMIIGRDHAGMGKYYGTYEAQEFVAKVRSKLGIQPVFFDNTFFCQSCGNMASLKTCPHPADKHLNLSGTRVREMLKNGEMPPPEFTRPEVARVLIDWAR